MGKKATKQEHVAAAPAHDHDHDRDDLRAGKRVKKVSIGGGVAVDFRTGDFKSVDEMHSMIHQVFQETGPALVAGVMASANSEQGAMDGLVQAAKMFRKSDEYRAGFLMALNTLAAIQIARMGDAAKATAQITEAELGKDFGPVLMASFSNGIDACQPVASLGYYAHSHLKAKPTELLSVNLMDHAAHHYLMPMAERFIAATVVPEGTKLN